MGQVLGKVGGTDRNNSFYLYIPNSRIELKHYSEDIYSEHKLS